jgi:hypothetical protein
MNLRHISQTLEKAGVVFEQGLTEKEIRDAESAYGFIFPPDLKAFLTFRLPVGSSPIVTKKYICTISHGR